MKAADSDGFPFVVWILPGIAIWNFINEAIMSSSNSIRTYSYLVKKVVFPVDIIPVISLVSGFLIQGIILVVVGLICVIFQVFPNLLQLIYFLIAIVCFIIALTRFTAAVTTLVPDFGQLLGIVMQLMFWFTPVLWNISMLDGSVLLTILKCSPFAYTVTGIRASFLGQEYIMSNGWIYTLIFWLITISLFVYGNYIFNKSKKEFADVL
jgi:ABC-type polysaccharide/polyol phosphate export permease